MQLDRRPVVLPLPQGAHNLVQPFDPRRGHLLRWHEGSDELRPPGRAVACPRGGRRCPAMRDDRPRGRGSAAARAPSARLRWPTQGSVDEVGVAPEHEVGERAARRVRGDDAVAGVAARPAEAACARSSATLMHQSRGTPSGPPQWWVIARLAGGREVRGGRRARAARARRRRARSRSLDRRAEPVRRAAAADRDPAVGRALGVEEEVAAVADQQLRPASRARPTPRPAAARWRSSASRAAGSGGARRAAASCSASVARSTMSARTVPRGAADAPRLDRVAARALVDRDAAAARTRRRARAPAAPGRRGRSAAMNVAAARAGDAHRASSSSALEQRARRRSPSAARAGVRRALRAAAATAAALVATVSAPALHEAAVDALRRRDPRRSRRPSRRSRARRADARPRRRALRVDGRARRRARRHPAAVAARRAEAGDLALDHDDPQVGLLRASGSRRSTGR